MDPTTRDALDALNRAFYARHATAFSDSRQEAWPGWERAWQALPESAGTTRVLDVGCGNGRLAAFLSTRDRCPLQYLGIDRSQSLLDLARRRNSSTGTRDFRFEALDFASGNADRSLPAGPFDWIALFGVLHHVPGLTARQDLLKALADRLAPGPGSRLAVSVWRFGAFERFQRRVLPWSEFNRDAPQPIDPARLEPGDVLLRWGSGAESPRYCHFVDDDELERLLENLPLELADRYDADGRTGRYNRYLVLATR